MLGVLVGLPALRLKGLYLAVSTLAAHFVIIVGARPISGGDQLRRRLHHAAAVAVRLEIASERAWYFFLLPAALAVLLST